MRKKELVSTAAAHCLDLSVRADSALYGVRVLPPLVISSKLVAEQRVHNHY